MDPELYFEMVEGSDQKWYFTLYYGTDALMRSTEGYPTYHNALGAVKHLTNRIDQAIVHPYVKIPLRANAQVEKEN